MSGKAGCLEISPAALFLLSVYSVWLLKNEFQLTVCPCLVSSAPMLMFLHEPRYCSGEVNCSTFLDFSECISSSVSVNFFQEASTALRSCPGL